MRSIGPTARSSQAGGIPAALSNGHAIGVHPRGSRRYRWAWLPVPVFLLGILVLRVLDLPQVIEPPYLLPVVNFIFSAAIMLYVAYLAARSYAHQPSLPVLLFGSGALAFGIVGLVAPLAIHEGRLNLALTGYNTGMLLSGLCHVAGAMMAVSMPRRARLRPGGFPISAAYGLVLALNGLIWFLALHELTPVFFAEEGGASSIRQVVLGSAVLTFALAGTTHLIRSARVTSVFLRFYAIGLILIAIGLLGILVIKQVGSLLGWAGRLAQYLGGLYFLIAVLAAFRESGRASLSLHAALERSEERFRMAAASAGLGDFHFDLSTGDSTCSPEFLAIYGLSPDESLMLRDGVPTAVHPKDRSRLLEEIGSRSSHALPADFHQEHRILLPSGEQRWVLTRGRMQFGAEGRPVAIDGIAMDITETKRIEEDLRESREQFRALSQALRDTNERLEQRVKERTDELQRRADQLARLSSELTLTEQRERQRLAQLLHDHLQQLLVGAKFALGIAQNRVPPDAREPIQQIEELIDESIKASRSLTVELYPPILHEAGLAGGLGWLARWMEDRHGLEVHLRVDLEPMAEREDIRVLLFQSVRELLFNVVKHAGVSEAWVALTLQDAGTMRIVVEDHGCGFDAATLAPDSRAAGTGDAGFGLLSIRERLALIGGHMQVDSRRDHGTRFTLAAPIQPTCVGGARAPRLAAESPAGEPAAGEPARAETAIVEPGETIRLLLVDDHEVVRQGLSKLLAENSGIEVVGEAADGTEALEQVRRLRPNIVLMDSSMPGMNGVEATRALRKLAPSVQVIGLSMYEERDRAAAMIDAGAAAYLPKSGATHTLIETVHRVHAAARRKNPHGNWPSYPAAPGS